MTAHRTVLRRFILITCLLVSFALDVVAKRDSLPSLDLGLGWGLTHLTSSDRLLNYFPYSGSSSSALQFRAVYKHNSSLFDVRLYYNASRLLPLHTVAVDYEYNYIEQTAVGGAVGWCREVYEWGKVARFYLGAHCSSSIDVQTEEYKNWLYPVPGSRRSYDFSSIALSPSFLFELSQGRSTLKLRASAPIFNLSARPDDDQVKRALTKANFRWHLYSLKSYQAAELAICYRCRLTKRLGISFEYNYHYRTYLTTDVYQYAQHCLLLGFSNSFRF